MPEAAPDPIAGLVSYTVLRWLEPAFVRGARVLTFGCDRELLAFLTARGIAVTAIDEAPDESMADGACLTPTPEQARRVAPVLVRRLPSGAPVRVCIPGRAPLAALVDRAVRGRGERRFCPSMDDVLESLGPEVIWERARGAGIVLPGPAHRAWAEAHPQAFALMAALDAVVAPAPLLRALSDRILIEGRRR
jgi:hypothetical protein